jgi:hypothetical protein
VPYAATQLKAGTWPCDVIRRVRTADVRPANVRYGSLADTSACQSDVYFTFKSGHTGRQSARLLCANSGLMRCSNYPYPSSSSAGARWLRKVCFVPIADMRPFNCNVVCFYPESGDLIADNRPMFACIADKLICL